MAWYHRFWSGWGLWGPGVVVTNPQPQTPQPWQAPSQPDSLGGYGPPSFNTNEFPGTRPQPQQNHTWVVGRRGLRRLWAGGEISPYRWHPDYAAPSGWIANMAPPGWRVGMPGAAVVDQYGRFLRWDNLDVSPYPWRVEPSTPAPAPTPDPATPAPDPWTPTPFTEDDWQNLAQWMHVPRNA